MNETFLSLYDKGIISRHTLLKELGIQGIDIGKLSGNIARTYQYMVDGVPINFSDVDDYVGFKNKIEDRLDESL